MLGGVDTTEFLPCDVSCLIGRLRLEGELLADLADEAGPGARVPTCPGWRVRDLLKHVGYVHRWAGKYVREQHTRWFDRASEEEILRQGPDDESLPGWFREGHSGLVATLEAADPGLACWTFLDAPSSVAFWARRQAHETAIHRVDAALAASDAGAAGTGTGPPFPSQFAADGIDELIMGFLGRDARRGSWKGPPGSIGIHADDGGGSQAHWRIVSEPGRLAVSREPGPVGCDVSGPAAALYLLLWNRGRADGLEVTGDEGVLAAFRHEMRVTWT